MLAQHFQKISLSHLDVKTMQILLFKLKILATRSQKSHAQYEKGNQNIILIGPLGGATCKGLPVQKMIKVMCIHQGVHQIYKIC